VIVDCPLRLAGQVARRAMIALTLCPVCLLVWAVLAVAVDMRATLAPSGPIYTVADVRAGLARDPEHWRGRAILVRGVSVPCLAMPSAENGLCTALAPSGWQATSLTPLRGAIDPLRVVQGGVDQWLARLRRLPLLAGMLPAPQALQWGSVATYRVRPQQMSADTCPSALCYGALLLP
jgi:hypothetical protein